MIYILLPVHNRKEITRRFVASLLAQTCLDYHLILIDDGSTDGTSDMVRAQIFNLTVLRGAGDWWWAGSLQQGIDWLKQNEVADSEIVLFMNDDVTFGPDFLQNGVHLLDHGAGMLLPQVINEKTGYVEETGVEADLRKLTFKTATAPEQINCLPTRGLFMRMSTLRKVGDFYPRLLPHYLSDYEFTIRAHRLGIKLLTSPRLLIHYDGVPSGFQEYQGLSVAEFVRRVFSIRSRLNPIYWTTFILLSARNVYVPWLILRTWLFATKAILGRMIFSDGK